MAANPQGDWTISDVVTLCEREGIEVRRPTNGSHYVLVSAHLRDPLTVPFNRPIKPRYIKFLVGFVRMHRIQTQARGGADD